jgi:hypothetical protein
MRNKIVTLTILISMLISAAELPLWAGFSKSYAGTSGAQFLKLGAGARASGMGEAHIALADDASAIYWNPAGLCKIEGWSMNVMHVLWWDDVTYDWVGYGHRVNETDVLGVGVQYMGYGGIDQTNDIGAKTGQFTPNDMAGIFSYGRNVGMFCVGGSMKYVQSKITRTASAIAFDFGGTYEAVEDKLELAGTINNIGSGLRYIEEETPLPMSIKIGAGYAMKENVKFALDMVMPNDNDAYIGTGVEYGYKAVSGRIGYNSRTSAIGGMSGITYGIGIKYGDVAVDYAYQGYEYLGDSHRLSVTWKGLQKRVKKTDFDTPSYLLLN